MSCPIEAWHGKDTPGTLHGRGETVFHGGATRATRAARAVCAWHEEQGLGVRDTCVPVEPFDAVHGALRPVESCHHGGHRWDRGPGVDPDIHLLEVDLTRQFSAQIISTGLAPGASPVNRDFCRPRFILNAESGVHENPG